MISQLHFIDNVTIHISNYLSFTTTIQNQKPISRMKIKYSLRTLYWTFSLSFIWTLQKNIFIASKCYLSGLPIRNDRFYAAVGLGFQESRKFLISVYYRIQACVMWKFNNCILPTDISATKHSVVKNWINRFPCFHQCSNSAIQSHLLDVSLENTYYSPENIQDKFKPWSSLHLLILLLLKCKVTQALTKVQIWPHYGHRNSSIKSKYQH